jgi:mannonate dehydratase
MIRRRDFLSSSAIVPALLHTTAGNADPPTRTENSTGRIRLGCQSGPLTDERLAFMRRHGVEAVCGSPPPRPGDGPWTREQLLELRGRVEKHGMTLDMIPLPFLTSTHIDRTSRPAIMLGRSPDRDREIEEIRSQIRSCSEAGIPAIKYNLNMLGVPRTSPTPGRGGASLSTWNLAEAGERSRRLTAAGHVSADVMWERIDYFLERVIPTATEFKVRLACHPHDPSVPAGFEGVDCVLGTVDGLKKLVAMHESPYHGLNFCQGTVCEMLRKPGVEIFDVIRYFGGRRKIFNVHFRNIRGGRDSFQETFPDEGDVDMVKALRVYREVGYGFMLMPDHVPHHEADKESLQAFAFCYGYIRGVLQASGNPA